MPHWESTAATSVVSVIFQKQYLKLIRIQPLQCTLQMGVLAVSLRNPAPGGGTRCVDAGSGRLSLDPRFGPRGDMHCAGQFGRLAALRCAWHDTLPALWVSKHAGQRLSCSARGHSADMQGPNQPSVLYQERDYLVVHKPAGWHSVNSSNAAPRDQTSQMREANHNVDSVQDWLRAHFKVSSHATNIAPLLFRTELLSLSGPLRNLPALMRQAWPCVLIK